MIRFLLFLAGTISLVVGIVGIFVPILPTTPLLLLAAACYCRSSERTYRALLNSRILGSYIRGYREGRGLPLPAKIVIVVLLWVTIGLSARLVAPSWVLVGILVAIALGVTLHLAMIPNGRLRERDEDFEERGPKA